MQHVAKAQFQARRVSLISKLLVVLVTLVCCELVLVSSLRLRDNSTTNLVPLS